MNDVKTTADPKNITDTFVKNGAFEFFLDVLVVKATPCSNIRMNSEEHQDMQMDTNYVFCKMEEHFKLRCVYEGQYAQNARNGIGGLYFEDGGLLKGKRNADTLNDDEESDHQKYHNIQNDRYNNHNH